MVGGGGLSVKERGAYQQLEGRQRRIRTRRRCRRQHAIGDPFLNYLALGILFFVAIVLFYGIIAIHDIPYRIAASRHHPHQDAIHAAGWVSLFTLHALWPFLWIWAMAYRPERGWGFKAASADEPGQTGLTAEVAELRRRVTHLETLARPEDRPEVKAPVSHKAGAVTDRQ